MCHWIMVESLDTKPPHRPLLRDGAGGEIDRVTADFSELAGLASNRSLPQSQRLKAFQEIIDSEVGNTTMLRARNLERRLGLRQIYLKFEGGNPTGTQKDRIAFAQVRDALQQGYETITLATCGNYGVAIALAASLAGLKAIAFIPESYRTRRLEELRRLAAEVRRVAGDYETAVECSREEASRREYYDANPGGTHSQLQIEAYGKIAEEILDGLAGVPFAVAVPVSNGTTLAGIDYGFRRRLECNGGGPLPRLVAGSSHGKNPIVRCWMRGIREYQDLPPRLIRETVINEPLVNWHSSEGQAALEALHGSGGWAGNASDRQMSRYSRWLRESEGLNVLPASAAGLIALLEASPKPLQPERYVAVVTGRKP